MKKPIEISSVEQLRVLKSNVLETMAKTASELSQLQADVLPLGLFSAMKFGGVGCDPLQPNRKLNIIEQINQAFTYLASFQASELLLREHPECAPLRLNLGTAPGSDIESTDGVLAAEVFAAVNPTNNQKLKKDIEKVAATDAQLRYSIFLCPGYDAGRQYNLERDGIRVWALSLD